MAILSGDTNPGALNDSIVGTSGADLIDGLTANDSLSGLAGPDTIVGGTGDDRLVGGDGADVLLGGSGFDTVRYDLEAPAGGTGPIAVNLGATDITVSVGGVTRTVGPGQGLDAFGQIDTLSLVEQVFGTSGNDTIIGDDRDKTLVGLGGADSLVGGAGYDFIDPGSGNDTVIGNGAFDEVGYTDPSLLNGLVLNLGATPNVDGFIVYTDPFGGTDQIKGIERIRGTVNADTLTGDAGNNRFRGMQGNDVIDGGEGTDRIDYTRDNVVNGATSGVAVNLSTSTVAAGVFTLAANTARDGFGGTDSLTSIEQVWGGDFGDYLVGGAGNETFNGNGGNDTVIGGGGTDRAVYFLPIGTVGTLSSRYVTDTRYEVVLDGNGDATAVFTIDNLGGGQVLVTDVRSGSPYGADVVSVEQLVFQIDFNLQGQFGLDTFLSLSPSTLFSPYVAVGSPVGDSIIGSASGETFVSGDGNDTIVAGGGNDAIVSGPGNDRIDATDAGPDESDSIRYIVAGELPPAHGVIVNLGNTPFVGTLGGTQVTVAGGTAIDTEGGVDTLIDIESVFGSSAADTIIGAPDSGIAFDFDFNGFGGNDSIVGGSGIDQVIYWREIAYGGRSGVVVNLSASAVTAIIESGTYTVAAGQARDSFGDTDTLTGIEGIVGTKFGDYLVGSAGANRLRGLAGDDVLIGGAGIDTVDFLRDAQFGGLKGVIVNLGISNVQVPFQNSSAATFQPGVALDGFGDLDTVIDIENVRGTASADTLIGSAVGNVLDAQDGNDFLIGGNGADTFLGGAGFDRVDFGRENGTSGVAVNLASFAQDAIVTDVNGVVTTVSVAANSAIDSYRTAGAPAVYNVDTLDSIENLRGTDNADWFSVVAQGPGGSINVNARGGNDTIINVDGLLTVQPGAGNDSVDGNFSGSFTTVEFQFDDDAERAPSSGIIVNMSGSVFNGVAAGTSHDLLTVGGQGNDTLVGVNAFLGTNANDTFLGGDTTAEVFRGRAGNDSIVGSADRTDIVSYDRDAAYVGSGLSNGTRGISVNLSGVSFDLFGEGSSLQTVASNTVVDGFGNIDTLVNIASVWGTEKGDQFVAGSAVNFLGSSFFGFGGDDTFFGNNGNDLFIGGSGHDVVSFLVAATAVVGNPGVTFNLSNTDRFTTLGSAFVGAFLSQGTALDQFGNADVISEIEEVWGSTGADTIYGSDDTTSAAFSYTYLGFAGADSFFGGAARDAVSYTDEAEFVVANGGVGHGVVVNLGTSAVSANTVAGVLGISPGSVNPVLGGTALDAFGAIDTITGIEGIGGTRFRDYLVGLDTISSGFVGYAGADTIIGGSGVRDAVDYSQELGEGGSGPVFVNLSGADVDVSAVTMVSGTGRDSFGAIDQLSGIEDLFGTSGDDTLFGSAAANSLVGGAGNDRLTGNAGADTLVGGDGRDWVDYGRETGTAATGVIVNLSQFSIAYDLGAGLVSLNANQAKDTFDTVDTLVGIEKVRGTNLADYIVGSEDDDVMYGRSGADTLIGAAGSDFLAGMRGDDLIDGTAAAGEPDGTDYDMAVYQFEGDLARPSGVMVNLSETNIAYAYSLVGLTWTGPSVAAHSSLDTIADGAASGLETGRDTLVDIEEIRGTNAADTLVGGDVGNDDYEAFYGWGGADVIIGGTGFDRVDYSQDRFFDTTAATGQAGVIVNLSNLTVNSIAGGHARDGFGSIDTLYQIEAAMGTIFADTLVGGAGDEQFNGLGGNDSLDGGAGFDEIRFDNRSPTQGANVNLLTGRATDGFGGNDTIAGFEAIRGTAFADTLIGDGNDNRFRGLDGNDSIDGGLGIDTVDFRRDVTRGGESGVQVFLNGPNGSGFAFDGFTSSDTLVSIENVIGTESADDIQGSAVANVLRGQGGNDTLAGGGGDDSIVGGAGIDQVDFFFARSAYTVSQLANGDFVVAAGAGAPGDGADTVSGVEYFSFADQTIAAAELVSTVNQAPAFTGSTTSFSIAENTTAVATMAATDPDAGAVLTYSISGGRDEALFTIDPATGSLSFQASPDFESPLSTLGTNVYDVDVTVSDGLLSDSRNLAVTVTNVNEAPVLAGSSTSFSIAENTTAVTTIAATDPDAGTALAWSISGGADAARFAINSTTGALSFVAAPNFEAPTDAGADNVYDVQVTASDGTLTASRALAVTVTNVNEAPTAVALQNVSTTLSNTTSTAARVKVADIAVTDDALGANSLALAGADAASFEIVGSGLYLRAGTVLNATTKPSYAVSVTVDDATVGATPDATTSYTLAVTNQNTAPTAVTFSGTTTSLAENTAVSAPLAVATVGIVDDGLGTNTLSLSGADAAFFTLSGGTLFLNAGTALNFEAKSAYSVTVNVDDPTLGATPDASSVFTLQVTNVNEAPVLAGSATSFSVTENAIAVTTIAATDPDAGTVLAYSISGGVDAARFAINSATGALSFISAPNFEVPTDVGADNIYNVEVTASDGSLTATRTLAVTVTNVNEAPVLAGSSTSFSIAENTTAVTTMTATDPDAGTALAWSISGGADAARFAINSTTGALSFVAAPNFEAPTDVGADNVYDVQVTASDGALSASRALAVTVTNVNEAPTAVALQNVTTTLSNTTSTTARVKVADIAVTDDALGANTLALAGADAASFEIVGSGLFLRAGTVLNATTKPSYAVSVTVDDATVGATPDASTNYTLAVTNQNTAPTAVTFSGTTTSLAENTAVSAPLAVATVGIVDDGLGTNTLSLSGADAAFFTLSGGTLLLNAGTALNFEAKTAYSVTVNVDDPTLGATPDASSVFTLQVTNVNEAPVLGATASAPWVENATGTILTVGATDPDAGSALTYAIVGGADQALFAINATTGALSFVSSPNFEAPADQNGDNIYVVQVQASDGVLTSAVQTVSVTVTNANEAPVFGSGTSYTVAENTTAVATLTAQDPDAGTTLTWSIVAGGDAARFTINSVTGALSFVAAPNFEAPADVGADNVYNLQVRASDGSLSATSAVSVTVTNVNEAATGIAFTNTVLAIPENTTVSTDLKVADLSPIDQDGVGANVFSLSGADASFFTLVGSQLFFRGGVTPDFETKSSYSVTVNVDDPAVGGAIDASTVFTLAVTDIVEQRLGSAANDTITGVGGGFTLQGLDGNDRYLVDSLDDVVVETATGGTDTVHSSVEGYVLPINVENLLLLGSIVSGTGNAGNNLLYGNASSNLLSGGFGDDTMVGLAGLDTMIGGVGNDSYGLDAAGDVVTEALNGGLDTVYVSFDGYVLAENTEVLVLDGASVNGSGNAGDNSLFGNALANVMFGGAGNDTLVGAGGDDILHGQDDVDRLFGQDGNDTLDGGNASDELIGGIGNDLLLGGAGADSLWGEAGNDTIDGQGGADIGAGAQGDDVYVLDEVGDIPIENAGEGTDTVHLFFDNYLLAANIENLALFGTAVTAAGNQLANLITGNGFGNTLSGFDGNDTIQGAGGADGLFGGIGNDSLVGGDGDASADTLDGGTGADTLAGGGGDDVYVLDSLSDLILETSGSGQDTAEISFDGFILAANVENLILTSAARVATGNELDNVMVAGAPGATLSGLGGNDTLEGSGGSDSLLGGDNVDSLIGGSGADTLDGGAGDDILLGGIGNDCLFGGGGADIFVHSGAGDGFDIIADYSLVDGDVISLAGASTDYSFVDGVGFVSILDASNTEIMRVLGASGEGLLLV